MLGLQISFLKEGVCIKGLKETDSRNSSCSRNLPFVFCGWQKTWFPGPNRCCKQVYYARVIDGNAHGERKRSDS